MPCTIVRLAGCPLRCRYCDTPQAQSFKAGKHISVETVCAEVAKRDRPLVLVTGGEPMAQPETIALLTKLTTTHRIVQLETSGAFDLRQVPTAVHRIIDIKTPASGESERNHWQNLETLHEGDEIKFVICDKNDYVWSKEVIQSHASTFENIPVLLSPMWQAGYSIEQLVDWMLADNLPARLQPQLHKIIWGAEAIGV